MGIHWERFNTPVLVPDQPWEQKAVMCPHVIYEEETGVYKMWYSGGETMNRTPLDMPGAVMEETGRKRCQILFFVRKRRIHGKERR